MHEEKKAEAAEKKRLAKLAKQPLPKPKGLPTDPLSGDLMSSKSIIATSAMLNDEPRDERAPLRTCVSIITAGNRTMAGSGEGQGDDIDTKALADVTGVLESFITGLLALYITEMKRASRSMKIEQFRRFMKKLNFTDTMIVNRLFEVFDVCKASTLTFAELAVGMCFFQQHKKWETSREDPLFLDYCIRFFDLDGQEKVSKFKLYSLANATFERDRAQEFSEAVWEVISGTATSLSYGDFQKRLHEIPDLRTIMHQMMVLQSMASNSPEYFALQQEVMNVTAEWRKWKNEGRIYSLDRLLKHFAQTSDKAEQESIAHMVDEIASARKGRDGLAASFYCKVLRSVLSEKNPKSYISEEARRNQSTLDSEGGQLEGDAKVRLEIGKAVMTAFKEAYSIS